VTLQRRPVTCQALGTDRGSAFERSNRTPSRILLLSAFS
jgi:hypothetical protein